MIEDERKMKYIYIPAVRKIKDVGGLRGVIYHKVISISNSGERKVHWSYDRLKIGCYIQEIIPCENFSQALSLAQNHLREIPEYRTEDVEMAKEYSLTLDDIKLKKYYDKLKHNLKVQMADMRNTIKENKRMLTEAKLKLRAIRDEENEKQISKIKKKEE